MPLTDCVLSISLVSGGTSPPMSWIHYFCLCETFRSAYDLSKKVLSAPQRPPPGNRPGPGGRGVPQG